MEYFKNFTAVSQT